MGSWVLRSESNHGQEQHLVQGPAPFCPFPIPTKICNFIPAPSPHHPHAIHAPAGCSRLSSWYFLSEGRLPKLKEWTTWLMFIRVWSKVWDSERAAKCSMPGTFLTSTKPAWRGSGGKGESQGIGANRGVKGREGGADRRGVGEGAAASRARPQRTLARGNDGEQRVTCRACGGTQQRLKQSAWCSCKQPS